MILGLMIVGVIVGILLCIWGLAFVVQKNQKGRSFQK
jgi:hypothetical protein